MYKLFSLENIIFIYKDNNKYGYLEKDDNGCI